MDHGYIRGFQPLTDKTDPPPFGRLVQLRRSLRSDADKKPEWIIREAESKLAKVSRYYFGFQMPRSIRPCYITKMSSHDLG